jgi:uncharacterized repeat protein (TIGR01451 family)
MAKRILQKLASILSVCLLAVGSLTAFAPAPTANAAYPNSPDCDANAVIRCGIRDGNELKRKYRENQGGDLRAIFAHFGMKNESALNGMTRGHVTKSGEIWVGNKKVATGAVTAGRHKMSNDEVKVPGANAWMRPPSRSFRSNSLETLVKLNDRGEFVYGVIMSCGNPVQAQHKIKSPPKKQKPQPKPQPKEKKPELDIKKDVRTHEEVEWQQEVMADPNGKVQYRITVENTSDTELQNLLIQDSLPDGVSFEDANLEGSETVTGFMISELVGDGIEID